MPTVTVRLFAGAAAAAQRKELTVEATTAAEVMHQLRASLGPEFARVLDASSILVNGTAARGELAEIQVVEESTFDVLPPFAGG